MAQVANLNLLKLIDRLCRENGIKYFIIGGGIVGHLRHGGKCVPWDEDVDVGMMVDEFIKLWGVLESFLPNRYFNIKRWGHLMRIEAVDFSCFIDILLYDSHETVDCYENQALVTHCLEKYQVREKYTHVINDWLYIRKPTIHAKMPTDKVKRMFKDKIKQIDNLRKSLAKSFKKAAGDSRSIIPMAWDCKNGEIYRWDTIFPTKPVEFEGLTLPFPNDPELYAAKCWGDIYKFPGDIGRLHATSRKLSPFNKYMVLKKLNVMTDEERWTRLTYKEPKK